MSEELRPLSDVEKELDRLEERLEAHDCAYAWVLLDLARDMLDELKRHEDWEKR